MNAPLSPDALRKIREANAQAAAMVRKAAGHNAVTPADIEIARRLSCLILDMSETLKAAAEAAKTSPHTAAAARSFEAARGSLGLAWMAVVETDAGLLLTAERHG